MARGREGGTYTDGERGVNERVGREVELGHPKHVLEFGVLQDVIPPHTVVTDRALIK